MRTGRRGAGALLLAGMVAVSCGRWEAAEGWDAGAARAVARRVEAADGERRLVVLHTVGSTAGAELPWGVRQSLTTAGIELGDSAVLHDPAVRLLILEEMQRVDGDWSLHTRTLQHGQPAARVTWRVRCDDTSCEVLDSLARTPEE
jgi:hypothetical protein